jgi:hypothetical protein
MLEMFHLTRLQNIALAKGSHERIPDGIIDCVCEYAVYSPDWLESSKAQDALWNLGWDWQKFCEPIYFEDDCEDFPNWKDADGNGCDIYEDERWCAEFGESENEQGISADDACCACGGGDELSDEF